MLSCRRCACSATGAFPSWPRRHTPHVKKQHVVPRFFDGQDGKLLLRYTAISGKTNIPTPISTTHGVLHRTGRRPAETQGGPRRRVGRGAYLNSKIDTGSAGRSVSAGTCMGRAEEAYGVPSSPRQGAVAVSFRRGRRPLRRRCHLYARSERGRGPGGGNLAVQEKVAFNPPTGAGSLPWAHPWWQTALLPARSKLPVLLRGPGEEAKQ